MARELAAAVREEFDVVRDRWVEYLLALADSPYRDRPRAELNETVARSLEAWIQLLEGREGALREFVPYIVGLRMGSGFSLAELHRASIGFRIVAEPLIEARYPDPAAAVRACAHAAAVCDHATLMLSEEWQCRAVQQIGEANRQNKERADRLMELSQENRRLAQELSAANSRLNAILRSVDSAILLVDTTGRVVFTNDRVRDLLGVEPEDLIGKEKQQVVGTRIKYHFRHADAFEQRLLWIYEHMEEEAVDELEVATPDPSATRRWLRRYSAPVRDESGRLLGSLTVYTDVTEERRTQELLEDIVFARTRELQEMNQRLVQRERLAAIGELAASIAHELRNPLGVVSNAAYLLRRRLVDPATGAVPAAVARTLETLETQVQRCSRVITELLDFARARPLRLEPVDPCRVVRGALHEHPIPKNIRLVTHLPGDIPTVTGDPQFLEQALSNLIANGLRALNEGGGELCVACRAAPGGVEFVVADQGPGMTDEVRRRVFEPLFTSFPGGTGLGLPLVKRIVEAHQGRVTVDSAPGAGATFTIFLPLRSADLTTEIPHPAGGYPRHGGKDTSTG